VNISYSITNRQSKNIVTNHNTFTQQINRLFVLTEMLWY